MHIFMDESGNFAGLGSGQTAVSVQGALILPDQRMDRIFHKYVRLRGRLPQRKGEVKGSLLDERQIAEVVEVLRRNEAIFAASMIDMGAHTEDQVDKHRNSGSQALAANLTEGHTPELCAGVADLQRRMLEFKAPLYSQMMVILDLLHRVLNEGIAYHCQRNPKELAAFHWVIDGKEVNDQVTDWEDWWSNTIVVWLQAISLKRPGQMLPMGDYRHFERFFMELPEYLRTHVTPEIAQRAGLDLQAIFRESFRFSSAPEPGLELVDIVTNALCRAIKGNLGETGWLPLRSIMIHQREPYVRAVSLGFDDVKVSTPYFRVIQKFRDGGRIMITKSNWDQFEHEHGGAVATTGGRHATDLSG